MNHVHITFIMTLIHHSHFEVLHSQKGQLAFSDGPFLPEKATGLGATCAKCLKQETRCSISS